MKTAALAIVATACSIGSMPEPPATGSRPIVLELAHMRSLGMDLVVLGRPVRAVTLYSEAPNYKATASPERDGNEGIACVDDAARAAVLYLRRYEVTSDPRELDEASKLLAFVTALESDGEYVNFVHADGSLNTVAPSSVKSFSYWAARALWAEGEAVRVLGVDHPLLVELRPVLDRTVARLAREVDAGRLIGSSVTATAEALLGLVDYHNAAPSPERAALVGRTADLLIAKSGKGPFGARIDPASDEWHAWGARATEALARAAIAIDRPDLAQAARREADDLWLRLVITGTLGTSVAVNGSPLPAAQIAYGVSPIVLGYLALGETTGDPRYSALAGIAAGWFIGANRADAPMYDVATGRVYDGIGADGAINRNAGAESTIEGLLALDGVLRDPVASEYLRHRPVDNTGGSLAAPGRRQLVGPDGDRVALALGGASGGITLERVGRAPIRLTYWPAANPIEVGLARELTARWNAANPDVQVRMQPIPAGRTSEEVLLAAIVSHSTPDVCSNLSASLIARLHRAQGLVRLDTMPSIAARLAERETPAMLESLRLPDGGLYALPWKANPMMILYNVDLLAKAGVSPPRTFSDLTRVTQQLARDTDGNGQFDRWAMWMPLKMSWHERFYDFYPLYLAASGGKTLVEHGKIVFDNDAALATFELLRAGFNAHVFPRANFADGRDPFLDGTVAMKMIGPWFLNELERLKIDGLHFGAVPVPVRDGQDPDRGYTFADMKSIAVFATTRHPREAARFAAYLTSAEADRRLIEITAQLPFRRRLPADLRFRAAIAKWPTLDKFAAQVERSRDLDLHPDIVEIFDILSEAYEAAAIYGVEPSAGALKRAAREARVVTGER